MHATATVTAPSTTVALLARARSLRDQAVHVHPVVAQAYRRRAAELRLQAWAEANAGSTPTAPDELDALIDAA
jgi:hypothetical protein